MCLVHTCTGDVRFTARVHNRMPVSGGGLYHCCNSRHGRVQVGVGDGGFGGCNAWCQGTPWTYHAHAHGILALCRVHDDFACVDGWQDDGLTSTAGGNKHLNHMPMPISTTPPMPPTHHHSQNMPKTTSHPQGNWPCHPMGCCAPALPGSRITRCALVDDNTSRPVQESWAKVVSLLPRWEMRMMHMPTGCSHDQRIVRSSARTSSVVGMYRVQMCGAVRPCMLVGAK